MNVSVLMTTYNQEALITQAIESVLMQEVKFDYEIVIGEDASTDRTREIVLEFQRKYPDRIRAMLRDAATSERDRARGLGGKTNFVQGLRDCRGKYVALLDGDDYWTDPHKLQKMVDFLESHPECSVSFHDAMVLYEDGSEPRRLFPANQKEISTLEDIITSGILPIPCTALFRNLLGELPDCFDTVSNGDWLLFVLLSEHGNLGYLNEVMAVYRVHSRGFWSQLNDVQQRQAHIKSWEAIDAHLNSKYKRVISRRIADLRQPQGQNKHHARSCLDQYHKLVKTGELKKGLRLLLEAIHSAPSEVFRPRRFIAVLKNGFLGILYKRSVHN
jgi:glycosyltransferase involved in cell wall biosynthesis